MPHIFSLDLPIDRTTLLKIAKRFAHHQGTVLLFSGGSYETSSRSFLGLFPYDFVIIENDLQWRYRLDEEAPLVLSMDNPWEALQALMPTLGTGSTALPEWMGFFGYEMGAFSDEDKKIAHHQAQTPDAYWQRCAIVLRVDHCNNAAEVCLTDRSEDLFDGESKEWIKRLSLPQYWEELISLAEDENSILEDNAVFSFHKVSETKASYLDKVQHVLELIRSGDVYQLNFSQQFDFTGQSKPFSLFSRLAHLNPAPFSAYLNLGDFAIVSSSPERFLSKSGDQLETRPIKGTAPRGKHREEDQRNQYHLLHSPKEKAELLMITDLMRNDLGKVSRIGSVQTLKLWQCEAYANVFHLHSVIRSEALQGIKPLQIVRACFPGGSITGCPKLSAMEAIAKLEQRPRGIYTGAIGYFAFNGDFDFNIAIRTFVATKDGLSVQLGGGIVADSDPDLEYQETLHKGNSIFKILNWQMEEVSSQ